VLGFSVFLLVEGIGYMRTGLFRTATNSGVNMALVYAAIPMFAGLSIAYSAANLLADVRAFRAGHSVEPRPQPAE
jgi:TRAP-type C4-dicarboxylate transport system permease small subunit